MQRSSSDEECSDAELLPASDVESAPLSRNSARQGAVVVVGVFFFTACVGVATWGLSPSPEAAQAAGRGVSPRMLLMSPDVVNLVAEHQMDVRRDFQQPAGLKQWQEVHNAVARKLQKHNADIDLQAPQLANLLDATVLTEEEQNGVLHLMKHVGDRRLQAIGAKFAQAKFDSSAMDKATRRQYIVDQFRPQQAEIQRLYNDVFGGLPTRLAGLAHKDLGALLQDAPKQRRLAATTAATTGNTVVNGVVVPTYYTTPVPSMFGDAGNALDEFKVWLNAFKTMFSDQVKKMNVPILSDLLAASDEIMTEMSCGLNAAQKYAQTQEMPLQSMMACPLKLGSSGMDQLGALAKDLGMDDPCDIGIGSAC